MQSDDTCPANTFRSEATGVCIPVPWDDWVSCAVEKRQGACDDGNEFVAKHCVQTCAPPPPPPPPSPVEEPIVSEMVSEVVSEPQPDSTVPPLVTVSKEIEPDPPPLCETDFLYVYVVH